MNNQVKHIMAIRAAILGISLLVLICVAVFAFLGALGATTIIYLLSCQTGAKSNAVYIVLAGSAVSVAGTIGFVGLIAPHIARLLVGNEHKFLVPLSAIFGAILLVVSDTVARTVFNPIELSVGIVTSVLGAPFFLWLLFRRKKAM